MYCSMAIVIDGALADGASISTLRPASATAFTVVLPNGDIINTGSRTKKTSAGYNLTNLFIGSEGTLGIITEIQLRLSPIPESIMSAVCHFPSLESAVKTAQQVIQYGVPIARIEMLNKEQM